MLAAKDADRHENGGRHANGHSSHKESDGVRPHVDGACAQRGDIKYGLNYGGGNAPDEEARWVPCMAVHCAIRRMSAERWLLPKSDTNTAAVHCAIEGVCIVKAAARQ